jgi:hypothetical protein
LVRPILIAAAVVGIATGCGGTSGRSAVTGYINDVNTIERQMSAPLNQMARTYAGFSTRGTKWEVVRARLERAQRTLGTLDQRLGRLDPPPEAERLHGLVLRLVGAEIGLAGEIHQLAVFLPRYAVVLGQLAPANARLSHALGALPTPARQTVRGTRKQIQAARADYAQRFALATAAQARVIEHYRSELAALIEELRGLTPPTVLQPSYQAELATLDHLRATGEALAQALLLRHYSQVPSLNDRFIAAARTSGSVTAQQAQIAAIERYNARIRGLNTLARSIQSEETRLENALS